MRECCRPFWVSKRSREQGAESGECADVRRGIRDLAAENAESAEMSNINDFIEPVRWLLGDHNDADRMFDDAAYLRGLRLVVKGGQVNGYGLDSDNLTIVPDVPDGPVYLLVAAKVARGFAASVPSRQGVKTRAWSETMGDYEQLLAKLEELIHDCESGTEGIGFQSYLGFINGYTRAEGKVWQFMTRLTFTGPPVQISMPY